MSAYRRVEPAISNFRRLPPPLETEIQRINEERDATIRKKRVRRKIKHALRNPLKTPQLEQTPIRLYHTRRRRSNLCIRGAEDVGAGFERSRQADDSSLGDFAASWRKEPERVQNVRCPEVENRRMLAMKTLHDHGFVHARIAVDRNRRHSSRARMRNELLENGERIFCSWVGDPSFRADRFDSVDFRLAKEICGVRGEMRWDWRQSNHSVSSTKGTGIRESTPRRAP